MAADPLVQFQQWFEAARSSDLPEWMEVNAMTLSTTDVAGAVTSRIVLLKGVESGRLFFYTNYDSDKGQQIAANPRVALCFFWPHLERQVRILGTASKTHPQQSTDYFHSRPRQSQLGALISRQSQVIEGRDELERRMGELQHRYQGQQIPCPEHWGGYEVQPFEFEFWQGRPSRLHDRIVYRTEGDRWKRFRLAP